MTVSAAQIREKIEAQLRDHVREYVSLAATWHRHRESCQLCAHVKSGASRRCSDGRRLLGHARAAKWSANMAGEEAVHVLGKAVAERIAGEEFPVSFRSVRGGSS